MVVNDLRVTLPLAGGEMLHALRGVSFSVAKGETLCLVGESGCGKSTTALSLIDLLAPGAARSGQIRLFDEDIAGASADRMEAIRGRLISMIFQDPMTSLNPAYTIGNQLVEGLLYHDPTVSRGAAFARARSLLSTCGITNASDRMLQFPHQLSGGLRQRVMIGMALMNSPALLLADEPTTALDVTIQAQILQLLKDLQREFALAIILITHDLGIVRRVANNVAVMYAGEIVEAAPVAELFRHPRHPYTRALLSSIPKVDTVPRSRLGYLPGVVPNLVGEVRGCQFRYRCDKAVEACGESIPTRKIAAGGYYRCVLEDGGLDVARTSVAVEAVRSDSLPGRSPAIELRDIDMVYRVSQGVFTAKRNFFALRGIDLTVELGGVLGIVGESGCGKTTLSRLMLGLDAPTRGTVHIMGRPIGDIDRVTRARWIQPVFQDPYSSLNPTKTVETIIRLPLDVHCIGSPQDRGAKVREVMDLCGLPLRLARSYPSQLSGGQRQRVAIASALVLTPKIIVCDEPTSSLDASVQSQILNLLNELRREFRLTYVLISHDLAVIRHMADRILVMQKGEIVEQGSSDDVFNHPRHEYTNSLLSSATWFDPEQERTSAMNVSSEPRYPLETQMPSAS
jgi:peptide/nickel transport system ATP-binding protein